MKNIIANIFAVLWFFGVLIWTLLIMFVAILSIFFGEIVDMLKFGFSSEPIGFVFLFLFGLVFGITGWVPAFRRCYYKLPWLYPLSTIMTMDLLILSIAEAILAKGLQVSNTSRHAATIIIMILQVVICRIVMCIYLKKNPMVLHKYDRVE